MRIRKSHAVAAVVSAAALIAGVAGAQSFEQTVGDVLLKDGAIMSSIPAQKLLSTENPVMTEISGERNRGGGRPSPAPRRPAPSPRRPEPRHPEPRHPEPRRPDPFPRHPGHERPGRGDWGRWHGHPGWGGRYGRFGDGGWLGWVIWSGVGRASCLNHYEAMNASCHGDCDAETNACVSNCSIFAPGDSACVDSCAESNASCTEGCTTRYDEYRLLCPF